MMSPVFQPSLCVNMIQNHLHLNFRKLKLQYPGTLPKGVRVPQHSGPAKGFGVPYEERGLGRR